MRKMRTVTKMIVITIVNAMIKSMVRMHLSSLYGNAVIILSAIIMMWKRKNELAKR